MLISRVADHCFWLGRYLERAEATARSLSSTRDALMGADLEERQSWLPIIIAAGERERFAEHFTAADPGAAEDEERVQHYMVWDQRNPSRLCASIAGIRANARSIRDHLSLELWEQINALHWWLETQHSTSKSQSQSQSSVQSQSQSNLRLRPSARAVWDSDRHAFYARIGETMAGAAGLLRTTMLRDSPFHFIILGTMIERAGQTARILDVQHHALQLNRSHVVIDNLMWLALLRACAGYGPFMRRHRGRVSGKAVATFLVQDPRFPRSIGFALQSAVARLAAVRSTDRPTIKGGSSRDRLVKLSNWVSDRPAAELGGQTIHEILTQVVDEVHAIADTIGVEFLGHEPR